MNYLFIKFTITILVQKYFYLNFSVECSLHQYSFIYISKSQTFSVFPTPNLESQLVPGWKFAEHLRKVLEFKSLREYPSGLLAFYNSMKFLTSSIRILRRHYTEFLFKSYIKSTIFS